MKVVVVIYLLILVSFYSCVERTPESRVEYKPVESADSGVAYLKQTFNRKGKLIVKEYLNADSVNHGDHQSYFRNSRTKSEGKYVNGLKEGTWLHYDDHGRLASKQNWFQGKQFGEQFLYDTAGRIKNYYFMNLDGGKAYHALFENDSIVKSEGVPFYLAYTGDSIQCGQEYEILFFFGIPPGMTFNVTIEEYLQPGRKIGSAKSYSSFSKDVEDVFWGKRIAISKTYSKATSCEWNIEFTVSNGNAAIASTRETIELKVLPK